jgi:hypothetical protein
MPPMFNSFRSLSSKKPSWCNLLRIATTSASVSGFGDPSLSIWLPFKNWPPISKSSGLRSSAGIGDGDIWCMISDKVNWGGFSFELIGGSNEGISKSICDENEIFEDPC